MCDRMNPSRLSALLPFFAPRFHGTLLLDVFLFRFQADRLGQEIRDVRCKLPSPGVFY